MICIYARQSIDKKDSISIESQIESCKLHISALRIAEETKIFIDKGYSGKNLSRPDFGRMMGDIENKLVSTVIVYKLDRISRSLLDFAQIIEMFKKQNIDFVSTQEKFDTSTPMGNAMLSIIMVFAQLERETIQLRIRDNYYARGKMGMYLGGPAPFGYKKVNASLNGKKTYRLEADENACGTLSYIYQQYANTEKSLGKIVKELNDKNIPSPSGAAWDSSKLSRIMKNPAYVKADADIHSYYKSKRCIISNDISDFTGENGCYLYGKRQSNERKYTDVSDHTLSIALHKGLISSDVFLRCQRKLDSNKQIKRSGASTRSWLSGLTKCPYCGYAMTILNSHKDVCVFVCSGRKNHVPCEREVLSFHVGVIEKNTEKYLLNELSAIKDKKLISTGQPKADNELKIKLLQTEEKIANLVEQIADGNEVVGKYLNDKILELDKEKLSIIEKMQKQKKETVEPTKIFSYLAMINNWSELPMEVKKEIAKVFIERINFYDDKIQVLFKERLKDMQ